MKTINELAQVLLTVDNKLDLAQLDVPNDMGGILVDDDLHRELYAAVEAVMLSGGVNNVSEAVDDDGGHFEVASDRDFVLAYQYEPDGVLWYYNDMRGL